MPAYMGWQDENKKPLETKIREALAYYRQHKGEPSIILVPPQSNIKEDFGVPMREDNLVRVNHIYIGHD